MIIYRITYFVYYILSKKPFSWKSRANSDLLRDETLLTLQSRFKQGRTSELKTDTRFTHEKTLLDVIARFKKPVYIHRSTLAGVTHDRLLYKKSVLGTTSMILYHFINERTASVTFQFLPTDLKELKRINRQIADNYLEGKFPSGKSQFSIEDSVGNKLIYNYSSDVKLTFVHNCPEILQNINVSVFRHKYSNEKYIDSNTFQLSVL